MLFGYLITKFQPDASPIPKNFPSWASWKSREVFLPAGFHSSSYFNKTLLIAKELLEDPAVLKGSKIDSPLLLLGLMYREVSRAMEIEPDAPTQSPGHLANSSLGIQQMKKIENLLKSLALTSWLPSLHCRKFELFFSILYPPYLALTSWLPSLHCRKFELFFWYFTHLISLLLFFIL